MADSLLIEEARRRGLVPSAPDIDSGLLEEAQRRGLISERRATPQPLPTTNQLPAEDKPWWKQLWSPETSVMTGASAGALAGTPAGPLGILAGGVLGAGAGSLIFDLSEDMPEIIETTRRGEIGAVEPMIETSRRALGAMEEEAKWAGGTMAAGPALRRLGKPLIGKMMGVLNPESRRMTDLAHAQGIDIGAAHVSPRKLIRAAPQVLGIFPFVGAPYRKGQAKIVGQLDERAADLLNTLAPASTRYDVAKGLTGAAVKRYKKFNRVSSALYDRFSRIADELPVKDIVLTQPMRQEVADVARREGIEQITLQRGVRKPPTVATTPQTRGIIKHHKPAREAIERRALQAPGTDVVGDYLKQLSDLPERITVEQARGLERQLNAILRTAGKEGWDVSRLSGMKAALTNAKNNLDVTRLNPEDAQRVLGAWQNANEFFAQSRRGFETPVAGRFGRVDKNIFRNGVFKPGTITQDQVFEAVYQSKSPDALADLRTLVGPGEFNKATRKFLETAFNKARVPAKEGALVEDMFSAADFEKRLGLNIDEGWEVLGEMLKGSDSTVKDWRNFLEVAKTATDITIRDPSTFITRRLVLGASIAGSVAMGAGNISIPAAVFISYLARRSAKGLMSGQQLKMMTRVLDDSTADHLRRTLVTRLLRLTTANEKEKEHFGRGKLLPRGGMTADAQ